MAERAILPDFPNCRARSYFRASVPGTGLLFFFFFCICIFPFSFLPPPPPSLSSWTFFFPFLYFIPHPAHCLTPLTHTSLHYSPFLSLLPIICRPPHPVSHFSKWWVLAYDRLSQVCFNYSQGDGDGTGGERRNFCVHIILKKLRIKCYLHRGGFCAGLLRGRESSSCANGPNSPGVFQGLVQEANLGQGKIIMGR